MSYIKSCISSDILYFENVMNGIILIKLLRKDVFQSFYVLSNASNMEDCLLRQSFMFDICPIWDE